MPVDPQIIVIAGLPGVGKSTMSRRLAEHFPAAAHVEADRLQELIVSGAALGDVDGIGPEAARQIRLRLHHAALLALSFREAGFTAVIDDIITGARFDELRDELGETPFSFIMLLRDLDVMKDSWRAMNLLMHSIGLTMRSGSPPRGVASGSIPLDVAKTRLLPRSWTALTRRQWNGHDRSASNHSVEMDCPHPRGGGGAGCRIDMADSTS